MPHLIGIGRECQEREDRCHPGNLRDALSKNPQEYNEQFSPPVGPRQSIRAVEKLNSRGIAVDQVRLSPSDRKFSGGRHRIATIFSKCAGRIVILIRGCSRRWGPVIEYGSENRYPVFLEAAADGLGRFTGGNAGPDN